MKVICVNNRVDERILNNSKIRMIFPDIKLNKLTIGKVYDTININDTIYNFTSTYLIKNDDNIIAAYKANKFMTISELRKLKLEKINEKKLLYNNKIWLDITEPAICARTFDDGMSASCILFLNNRIKHPCHSIIALEDITANGGLKKFDVYNAGFQSYQYRKLTNDELINLIENIKVPEKFITYFKSQFGVDIIGVFNSQIKIVRKLKLERINNFNV
jgi:ribosomal protein L30/L7E